MAESSIADDYFHHLVEYGLAVCKECRHGVLPSQVRSHLQRAHRISRKQADSAAEEVSSWVGLVEYASELLVPEQVAQPISQLPLYTDGLMCQLEPARCYQIFRSVRVMKNHWREDHNWSAARKGGRPSRVEAERIQARISTSCKTVHCQRLLVQGQGSQYFEIQQSDEDGPDAVPIDGDAAWARVGEQMARAWANIETQTQNTIQAGEKDEVNPWLERTQWLPYLMGMNRPDLLTCIEEPVAERDLRREEEPEPVEAAIWKAMDELARFSQASVIDRVGVFVRLEAIRTEKHQTRFQPLQPYMDEKAIVNYARPWKQMLMFFARTQREHTWKSPKYRFTRRQRETWKALVEAAERSVEPEEKEGVEDEEMQDDIDEAIEEMEADEENTTAEDISKPKALSNIQKACLEFCIALLSQSITRKEYDSPLVCALAVLGVKEDGWKGAEQYPPILSAVIKVARFMVVQYALELSGPLDEDEFESDSAYDSDNSSNPPRQQRKGCLQFVQEMMDRFMVRGSHSPMQWMLDLRTYGLKIHYNTTSRGHVEWIGKDELLYKSVQFTMAQFRSMVHGVTVESRRLLMDELLFGNSKSAAPVPSIPWESLRDNPTDDRPGWNFLKDHRTRMPVDGEKWLFERVGQDARVRDRFVKPGTRSGINRQEVERYMDRVIAFREKLIVLMHMTGGQPARGPEILSVRHSNTVKGGHRNIFIEDGMVVFVTRYHKGYAVSGDVKIIHRYLPGEVGELLVYYMWLVLPFQQRLEAMVWEKEAISSHMWPADPSGRKWTSDRLREALKHESRVGLGQELTIAAYREIAIGISRRFLRGSTAFRAEEGEENQEWNEENMASAIADEQAGHTAHIAGMIYARGIMEQAGAIADKRQQFRMSSTDWHRFLGFQSSSTEESSCRKRKRAPFENEADEARIDRWERLRKMNTTMQLQRMMDRTAKFRGIQKDAIDAIVAGESPIVAVMPTGAGKSILFMLPAWAEQGGTTIVIVPLIALRGDMMRRCKKLGILCAEWEGRRAPDAAAIVLVTPESAVGEDFATFLNRLRATRQLDRIVIDECHIVLNRRYNFRKEMQKLGKLVVAETQMVLLTATLPPSEEDELFQRMHFDRDQVKMFRTDTTRTNVAYRVIKVDKAVKRKEAEAMVLGMVQRKLEKHKMGKVVIYGNSVSKVKELAKILGCHVYHHNAMGKESMLLDFLTGKHRVIVATSALGMGVDIPDVRCIIHIDWPFSILDYAQESGRAGRDGLRSEAILIVHEGQQYVNNNQADAKQAEAEQALVKEYVGKGNGKVYCRREVLDRYLDGRKNRVGCKNDGSEEICDVCCGGNEQLEEPVADEELEDVTTEESDKNVDETDVVAAEREELQRLFQQQEQKRQRPWQILKENRQQEFADIEWVRRQLAWWANRCGICEGARSMKSSHDIRQCWRAESAIAKEMIEGIEKNIRFEDWSGCFLCGGIPQEICNSWEPNNKGRYQRVVGGNCQYSKGTLTAALIGVIVGYNGVQERWIERLKEFKVGDTDDRESILLVKYLGQKQKLDTVECNNLVKEFCWVTRLIAA